MSTMELFTNIFVTLICSIILIAPVADGHLKQCDKDSSSCEFFLDVDHWLPMRLGPNKKVYVNSTDGKVYLYNDDTSTEINPHNVVLADGSDHERVLALFNKTMPGPTLIVYKTQEVVVHVTNHMLSDGVSVHFHGIEMRDTPWMDGAAFITQCPIMPGQTFTYRFRPNRSGTYFYHAHLGMQMGMGLVAPFIVKERSGEDIDEHIMVIQDYNNRFTGDDIAATARLGLFYPGGVPIDFSQTMDGYLATLLELTSTLINGRGRVYDKNGRATTHTPLSVFRVASGNRYKFRVIGAGYGFQYKVSVDGHKLDIIAMDGHDIEPVSTDYVILHSGERVDFIINADQATSNYWIRAETLKRSNDQPGYAILRYVNAPDVEPRTNAIVCNETTPCIAVNCPFPSTATWTCINVEELNNLNGDDSAPVPKSSEHFKEFFINSGFSYNDEGSVSGHVNGVSLKLPPVSALTQPWEVTGICDDSHNCGPERLCFCNRPLNVEFGDIVQITFLNMGQFAFFHHPMHVHGYSFYVTKVGYGEFNDTSKRNVDNSAVDCHSTDRAASLCNNNVSWTNRDWSGGNVTGLKVNKAIKKDTVTVPANGYVTVRFRADNPGLWFIHCHMELHIAARGMGLLLNDSFPRIPPPPDGFPECRSFPSPRWLTKSSETTTASSTSTQSNSVMMTKERTFTEKEFWGMVGALLFVIIVQFVITVLCLLRSKSEHSKSSYTM